MAANTQSNKQGTKVGLKTPNKVVETQTVIKDIQPGDIFSETSHYKVDKITSNSITNTPTITLKHIETNKEVVIQGEYIRDCMVSADQYFREERVGREDKLWTQKQITEEFLNNIAGKDALTNNSSQPRVGDVRTKGIRSIFEGIYDSHVFIVEYEKQATELSSSAYLSKLQEQREAAIALIEQAQKSKKGVKAAALEALKNIQENPISKLQTPELRRLRGYKTQFESRDGRYNCVDMDISDNNNIRPVNINTIKALLYKGVRYIVE
jgi:hypothetical protein